MHFKASVQGVWMFLMHSLAFSVSWICFSRVRPKPFRQNFSVRIRSVVEIGCRPSQGSQMETLFGFFEFGDESNCTPALGVVRGVSCVGDFQLYQADLEIILFSYESAFSRNVLRNSFARMVFARQLFLWYDRFILCYWLIYLRCHFLVYLIGIQPASNEGCCSMIPCTDGFLFRNRVEMLSAFWFDLYRDAGSSFPRSKVELYCYQ
jgi:hypothetical protein